MFRIPFACQMFSVHKALADDFEGTVRAVAKAGYTGVEFFGGLARPAAQVKAILEETGLKIVGWHSSVDDFSEENFAKTIAYHKELGNKSVVIPGLPAEMTSSAAAWHKTAAFFTKLAARLADEGMWTGYHNHFTEFTPVDGEIPWDILASETPAAFALQIDNGNAMHGGADPMVWLKKYPGRARTFHFKPHSAEKGFDVTPGVDDDIPWQATVDELIRQGATEWVIAEYETEALYSEVEGVKVCYDNLGKFLK
ncbi:MAG: TIM barrel protein [Clostridia bacterium]|nr:TIM barrel protein [Clostridia bacterium]